MAQPALSHRSEAFQALLGGVRQALCGLTGAADALLMAGSGTTANDAIAAQLAAEGRPGLVLSNGEFGERLIDHARRWGLPFETERADWGHAFDAAALARRIEQLRPAWLWAVACETSTGVDNRPDQLLVWCRQHGAQLCLDAVSALGLQPLDLHGVHLASAVSGKALGSLPGLAIVLHDGRLVPAGRIVRSLDLAAWRDADGVAYTLPSNAVAALDAALQRDWPARWARVKTADARLREGLAQHGFTPLARAGEAMPGVLTLVLPPALSAERLARRMERRGYQLAWRSAYLQQRNALQICLMGEWVERALEILPEVLATQARGLSAGAVDQAA
jgi:aspartate aminotransferase-like enzyme